MSEGIVGPENLGGALDQAFQSAQKRREHDPKWTKPHPIGAHDFVEAFAVGVLSADPWYWGYRVPPGFEAVVNWIAFCVDRYVQSRTHIMTSMISMLEFDRLLREWATENPTFQAWNDPIACKGHEGECMGRHRVFIDLEAVFQNAAHYMIKRFEKLDAV